MSCELVPTGMLGELSSNFPSAFSACGRWLDGAGRGRYTSLAVISVSEISPKPSWTMKLSCRTFGAMVMAACRSMSGVGFADV